MKTKIKNRFTARGWRSLNVLTGPRLGACTGCAQVWVNPSTRGEYKLGQLQGFVDRDFTAAQAAAKIALKDLGLFETRDDRKPAEAELRAHDSADTLVTVKMKEAGKNLASVKVRYGLKGDLASAQKVCTAIEKRL